MEQFRAEAVWVCRLGRGAKEVPCVYCPESSGTELIPTNQGYLILQEWKTPRDPLESFKDEQSFSQMACCSGPFRADFGPKPARPRVFWGVGMSPWPLWESDSAPL